MCDHVAWLCSYCVIMLCDRVHVVWSCCVITTFHSGHKLLSISVSIYTDCTVEWAQRVLEHLQQYSTSTPPPPLPPLSPYLRGDTTMVVVHCKWLSLYPLQCFTCESREHSTTSSSWEMRWWGSMNKWCMLTHTHTRVQSTGGVEGKILPNTHAFPKNCKWIINFRA